MKPHEQYYTIDRIKTPKENILEILKIIIPIEISTAKMSNCLTYGYSSLCIGNIEITPVYIDKNKYITRPIIIDKAHYFNWIFIRIEKFLPSSQTGMIYKYSTIPINNNRICLADLKRKIKYLRLPTSVFILK